MQSDNNELYRLTSLRTGKSEQVYKEVGNAVFKELNKVLRRPQSLITKLKGVGSWYLRKNRMETILKHFPLDYEKALDEFTSKVQLFKYENKKEIHELFKLRLKEYETYVNMKREIKRIRHGDTLHQAPAGDDQSNKASQADSGEH